MNQESLGQIFINACLVNNFVLAYFLGICPFLGVSGKLATASKMGGAVMFVMLISSICAYAIHAFLVVIGAEFLQLISYIVVIASTVQLVEMFIKKMSPTLFKALGIFLPLITTNCAILGLALFQTNKGYDFVQSIVYALGAGTGFTLALVLIEYSTDSNLEQYSGYQNSSSAEQLNQIHTEKTSCVCLYRIDKT